MILNNKKAGERYLSPWMILIWIIVGVAIVISVLIFYSVKLDVREKESEILIVRIADCLVEDGYLRNLDAFDVFADCNIEKSVIENGNYYLKVSFSDNQEDILAGVKNFETLCGLENSEGDDFPRCSKKRIYALKDGEKLEIEILAASNQIGKEL